MELISLVNMTESVAVNVDAMQQITTAKNFAIALNFVKILSLQKLLSSAGSNRFRGCRCEGVCDSNRCPCVDLSRECDPDLCRPCTYNCTNQFIKCKNMAIQRDEYKVYVYIKFYYDIYSVLLLEKVMLQDGEYLQSRILRKIN